MKTKRTSAVLTLVVALFIGAFLAFAHILLGSDFLQLGALKFATYFAALIQFDPLVWAIVNISVLAVALVLALIWIIRLLVYRRNVFNLLSPIVFLVAVFIGIFVVDSSDTIESFFGNANTIVVTGYLLVTAAIIVALAIHLVIVGLITSGPRKKEQLIDEEVLAVDEEVDSTLSFDEEEDEEEELVEVEEVVVYEEEEEEFDGEVEEDEEEVEFDGEVEDEEIEEVVEEPIEEEVVEEAAAEVVERVIHQEIVQTIVQEPDYESEKLEEIIRKIIREELKDVEVRPEPVKEEPKVAPKPVAKPAPKPVAKPAPKPVAKPKVATPPAPRPQTVERIPFAVRLESMETDIQEKYEELRDYLLSYDIKSRVSNSGDSFRLSRKLYAKITTSGNTGLKIYLPVDITDYADTKLPLKNASHIKAYADVPTFLYIKSDLSVRRAKQLIDDVMLADGIVRKFQREDLE
ncbi:MAG TPA: hypothetical protein VFD05_04560 [Bacilli bacterium]|nr:hypothetical protein [Bacilli bacterium]